MLTMSKMPVNEYGYFYDFRHINVSDLEKYPNGLKDIQNRKLDGVIIRQVLTPEEVQTIVSNIEIQKENIQNKVRTGYTFPRAYFDADKNKGDGNPFENNFIEWAKWRNAFPEMFGVDIEARITSVFQKMAADKQVVILNGPKEIGSYIPATIRVFHPHMGGIPVHCGNMFEELLPTLYKDLMSKVITKNQMSYFIQLQTPQRGGELTIYDLEWIPGQASIDENEIKLNDGTVIDTAVEGVIEKYALKINPGDMLIFAAGEIWHRVETPLGKSDRITVGGFLGFTKDGKSVSYWS